MAHTAEIARWVRLSGTEDERKAFDYIDATLQAYGLTTRLHEPTCLVSLPLSGAIMAGDDLPITGITHAFSSNTGDDGVAGGLSTLDRAQPTTFRLQVLPAKSL